MNPFSHFLPLLLPFFLSLGYKGIGPPSMKGKKVKKFWDKISLTVCKWSSLNAQGTETPVSHSLMSESLFSYSAFPSLQYKELGYFGGLGKKVEIFGGKISLTVCKWSSLNAPWSETPVYNSFLESSRVPFSARVG